MFTGIIESLGRVADIRKEGSNLHFRVESSLSHELKIDQSISHNGVCLTVVDCDAQSHLVTAVEETLRLTSLGSWRVGDAVNLERAMLWQNARLDGHLVQGHVDKMGACTGIEDRDGSWYFHFQYVPSEEHLLVNKGSICVNGVSLTVVNPQEDGFSVAIIPYTYEHTTFKELKVGDPVNLEFDVIGKYIAQYAKLYMASVQ
jgi:riboflavin synthase